MLEGHRLAIITLQQARAGCSIAYVVDSAVRRCSFNTLHEAATSTRYKEQTRLRQRSIHPCFRKLQNDGELPFSQQCFPRAPQRREFHGSSLVHQRCRCLGQTIIPGTNRSSVGTCQATYCCLDRGCQQSSTCAHGAHARHLCPLALVMFLVIRGSPGCPASTAAPRMHIGPEAAWVACEGHVRPKPATPLRTPERPKHSTSPLHVIS